VRPATGSAVSSIQLVGANGEVGENDRIGDEVLDSVDGIDDLLDLGPNPGIPSGSLGINRDDGGLHQRGDRLASMQPNCNLHWSCSPPSARSSPATPGAAKVDAKGKTPNILGGAQRRRVRRIADTTTRPRRRQPWTARSGHAVHPLHLGRLRGGGNSGHREPDNVSTRRSRRQVPVLGGLD